MILLAHIVFGAATGSMIKNIPAAIILAFLGHYFLDVFPHIEYLKSAEESIKKIKHQKWQEYLPDILKVMLDFSLGFLVIFLFSKNQPIIYICAIIAIIPDGLTVITWFFPNKILLKHHYIHGEKVHYFKHKKTPKFWRIATQVSAIIISVILLKL